MIHVHVHITGEVIDKGYVDDGGFKDNVTLRASARLYREYAVYIVNVVYT